MTFAKALLASSACLLVLASSADARRPARFPTTGPSCEIAVHPDRGLKPGQTVKISWRTKNAASATLDQNLGAGTVTDQAGFLTDRPSKTKIYSMSVTGADGATGTCRVAVAVPERSEPRQWPPPQMAGLPADYLERARAAMSLGITNAKLIADQRWVTYATISLLFEQDMEAINDFFANHWKSPQHPDFGFGLFSLDTVRLYGLYNGRAGTFPGRLTPAAQKNMEEQLYRVASQMELESYDVVKDPTVIWKQRGSENHTLAAESSFFLVAQFLKNTPELAKRPYEDGKTAEQHYETWRKFFFVALEERIKRGMYIEVGSPSYEDESRQAIQNLRDFAEDPVIRKKAEMALDVSYALIAQDTINGVRGNAKSRAYTFKESFWGGPDDRVYNVIFGPPGYPQLPMLAASTYLPPPAILNLGKDLDGRGTYEMIQRLPGVGVPSKTTTLERDRSVYRYGFATPGYVLGSFVLDPKETYIAPSSQNRWQGIIFEGDPGARIAPQVVRFKGRDKELDVDQRVHNAFLSLQDRNVLIMQRWAEQTNFSGRTDLYFASTLDLVEEEDGWIFVREKNSFAAVKVVTRANQAYEWLDPRTKNKNDDKRKNFITLADPQAPMILVANQAADYGGDFARFKAAVKAQPIRQESGALSFATLAFHGSQKIGSRDGKQVDIAPRRVYDSPFMRSDFASGVVYIRKGDDTVKLDLSKPDDPVKTVGAPVTQDFPDGIGKTKPIVFGSR